MQTSRKLCMNSFWPSQAQTLFYFPFKRTSPKVSEEQKIVPDLKFYDLIVSNHPIRWRHHLHFHFFRKISPIWQVRYLAYPDSFLVVLHFVHLKNVIVEWIVSSAASTFQISLSVFPHFSQTTWIVGSCLSIASLLWSMTAISATLPRCRLIFLFDSLCSIGFWYLHFGHLSVEDSFFAIWSIDPHFGQKSIVEIPNYSIPYST